jgi:hypothetical protein
MFTVDLDTLRIDCDPYPVCVRLRRDPIGRSSLNPTVEQVLLASEELAAICEAYNADSTAAE